MTLCWNAVGDNHTVLAKKVRAIKSQAKFVFIKKRVPYFIGSSRDFAGLPEDFSEFSKEILLILGEVALGSQSTDNTSIRLQLCWNNMVYH